jgi:hypothetical protein
MFFDRHWIPGLPQAQGKHFAGMTVKDVAELAGTSRVEKVEKAGPSGLSTLQLPELDLHKFCLKKSRMR